MYFIHTFSFLVLLGGGLLIKTTGVVCFRVSENCMFLGDLLNVVFCCPVMVWATSSQ